MPYAVVTSKKAKDHFNMVKAQHAQIIQGMAQQSQKVQQMNQMKEQQRAAEMQNRLTMNHEMDKAKMVANTQVQKNSLDFASKQADQDIKRAEIASM